MKALAMALVAGHGNTTQRVASVVACLVVLLTACSSSPRAPAAPPKAASAATSQAPSPVSAATFAGLIFASVSFSNTVTLDAIDPATGNVTATRTFSGGQATLAIDPMDQGAVWRCDFNSSFTEAAATGPQASDGSQSAGYVNTSGTYTALTAGTSGYSSVLDKMAIGFAPNGDLWYMIQSSGNTQFGHVSPAVGSSSDELYNGATPYQTDASGTERAYVTPAGAPDAVSATLTTTYLPGGTEVTQDLNGPGYLIGPWGKITSSTPDTPIEGGGDDWMVAPVNSRQFLTSDNGRTQLWLNTIDGSAVQTTPILPATNRAFISAVVSPDGHTVAILDSDGTLWTVPVTGGSPQQVTGFSVNITQFSGLMAWT